MQTIRICRKLESITLHLPELTPFVGKTVEFIVREESLYDMSGECLPRGQRLSLSGVRSTGPRPPRPPHGGPPELARAD